MSIVKNNQLFNGCYILNDVFLFMFERKSNASCYNKNEKDDFCSEFIQKLFTKIFEAITLFQKLNDEYPNTMVLLVLHFFQENVNHEENKFIILRKKIF